MILCCGEALIDMLPGKDGQDSGSFHPYPGGAVYNTAIALGRLGAPVGLFTGLSTDFFGEMLQDHLQASGVDLSLLHYADKPSTLAFVQLQDGQARYVFYDENTAGRTLSLSDIPSLPPRTSALFFGGIYLAQEPCGTTFETFMTRTYRDAVTMFDPNIRPGFIADETAYRARLDRMLACADIIKLSDEDLAWINGNISIESWAQGWLDRNASLVVVTRGDKGAIAYGRDATVETDPIRVSVADTVGAGDTFNAGLLASLQAQGLLSKRAIRTLSEQAISQALSLATRAAAVTVSRPGANPPWQEEVS